MLPAVLFFLVAFNVITLTTDMMMPADAASGIGFLHASVGALIAGKVLLIVDMLPFVDAFRGNPLIFNMLWKAGWYSLAALLFRIGDHPAPLLVQFRSVAIAGRHFVDEINWRQFWAVQIWILVLLIVLVSSRELIGAVGAAQVRKLFFGR